LIKLIDVNEKNWMEVRRLCVRNDQQAWLDDPAGIIARGYVYRSCNAKVTDTAESFYLKRGYVKVPGCRAKNNIDVYVKRLK